MDLDNDFEGDSSIDEGEDEESVEEPGKVTKKREDNQKAKPKQSETTQSEKENDNKQDTKNKEEGTKKKKVGTRPFDSLGLSRPLLRAVEALDYPEPTPIQAASIPLILMGKDILGKSRIRSIKCITYLFIQDAPLQVLEKRLLFCCQVWRGYCI